MEISGYHTPKRSLRKVNQKALNIQNNSPIHLIKRRKSFIPYSIFRSFQNKYENSYKDSKSIKKSSKINFSGVIIPEEQENNNGIRNNIKSDSFSNLINNIYGKDTHLNKNIISGSGSPKLSNKKLKRNYISNKTLYNAQSKRMSSMNSLSLFSKMKNKDNTNKDGLTINSNYNTPKNNHKLCEKIDYLLHKKELTKNEKETILNFLDKSKDCLSSPKHKTKRNNGIQSQSPKSKKRKKKNNNVKFKEKKAIENNKTQKEKTENEENSNTRLPELKSNSSKIRWFKTFLCCLESN